MQLLNDNVFFSAGAIICLLLAVLSILYLMEKLNQLFADKRRAEISLKAMDIEHRHINEIESVYQQMLKQQHDIRHYLNTVESLLDPESGNSEILSELKMLRSYENNYITGRISIDALLNSKTAYMIRNGIKFSFQQYPLNALPMSNSELCLLFSNLLDNAIEGVMRTDCTEKRITLKLGMASMMYSITCINNADIKTINKRGAIFLTSKSEKNIHGFGIPTIKSIVEKYDGCVSFITLETEFRTEILIPIQD